MITLTKLTAADNRAAKPAPPHFKKLFFARQARRTDHADSTAAVIKIGKTRKSSMEHHPSTYEQAKLQGLAAAVIRFTAGDAPT
jgi:hypothetical protein